MLCEEHKLPLPEEYYLKVPPVVDDNYMANLKQKKRVERLVQQGNKLTRKKTKFIDELLDYFVVQKKHHVFRVPAENEYELAEKFAERRHLLDKHLKERRPDVYSLIEKLRDEK